MPFHAFKIFPDALLCSLLPTFLWNGLKSSFIPFSRWREVKTSESQRKLLAVLKAGSKPYEIQVWLKEMGKSRTTSLTCTRPKEPWGNACVPSTNIRYIKSPFIRKTELDYVLDHKYRNSSEDIKLLFLSFCGHFGNPLIMVQVIMWQASYFCMHFWKQQKKCIALLHSNILYMN